MKNNISKKIKYYGTLGPSCCDEQTLIRMLEAGMTGIRLNLSHKSLTESEAWIYAYQKAARATGKTPDLLVDLVGPEIRIGDVQEPIHLKEGEEIIVGKGGIPIPFYIEEKLEKGQILKLDDGKIELKVCRFRQIEPANAHSDRKKVICRVQKGGILKSRKSLAVPGLNIQNPTLTAQDYQNLELAKQYGVTEVMLPFVRNKEDLCCLKDTLTKYHSEEIRIFAKIENMDGVEKLPELIPYCDEIVIARGDLGNAVPLSYLPVVQHQIADLCRTQNKPFMIVTQMLNSMITNPVPTRAEVNDIFHAVMDGASSVMLTGETAAGDYPVEAMRYLIETGEEALRYHEKICTQQIG